MRAAADDTIRRAPRRVRSIRQASVRLATHCFKWMVKSSLSAIVAILCGEIFS
jgi:hypothetical protein